ncbi:hypothetical protein GCM10010517_13870 [Streptosporangium fragile]|uniref:Heparinase n=1 Tax=Streptosporangium fragile TaxID=46186 RepID=A0ABP6IAJ0_9ACTN
MRRDTRPAPLDAYLARLDARYDAEARMPWCRATGPGYHTRVPAGSRAHQTREAADYALALLRHGGPGRVARAGEVLEALVGLQVTDPLAEHYGIWGWFLEEPPRMMAPADWNWADFIGVRLAQVLAVHGDLLDAGVADRVRTALYHAAMSIFRRNVDPEYTNIAVMGAVVSAAAGEILRTGFLLDYGRRRLDAVLALFHETGGFTEYNSPAYSRVVLEELERAALIVADPAFGALAEELRRHTWAALAERFHPGTGQLAGPMSRAYHDRLPPDLAAYLAAQTSAPVVVRAEEASSAEGTLPGEEALPGERVPQGEVLQDGKAPSGEKVSQGEKVPSGEETAPGEEDETGAPPLVPPLPCPDETAARFRALPADPFELRTRFSSGEHGETVGTTWFTEDACLGSANEEFAWTQRRPLLGYWRTPDDPAVVLRARMLLNGHDLSAAWCRQAQDGPRLLSAWWLSYDSGDFHPALDKPPGSVFDVGDLRLVVSLSGRGVRAEDLGGGTFALAAGDRRALVHTAPAAFLGEAAPWRAVQEDREARIEAVLHAGPRRPVDFHEAVLTAAFALELLGPERAPGDAAAPVPVADPPRPGRAAGGAVPGEPGPASTPDTTGAADVLDAAGRPDTAGVEGAEGAVSAASVVRWRWRDLTVPVPARPTPFGR